ncbi:hypothetical protein [Falsiruegeria litorea]|nr:hypothetical protein [Falsiruegeria litorea]
MELMALYHSTNAVYTVSEEGLISALEQVEAEIDHQPESDSIRTRIMRTCFDGSGASGAWD